MQICKIHNIVHPFPSGSGLTPTVNKVSQNLKHVRDSSELEQHNKDALEAIHFSKSCLFAQHVCQMKTHGF